MSTWETALAAAGFRPEALDDAGAWDAAVLDDAALDVVVDVVRESFRLAVPAALDLAHLFEADAVTLSEDPLDDLFDDLTQPGRTPTIVAPDVVPPAEEETAEDDSDAYTMTGEVVGVDADPDVFAAALDALSDVDPVALDAWQASVAPRLDGEDDVLDTDADEDDDLDEPGDWHLPR